MGYAAACDVFGASLYEPCGQIDQVGNIFGATATNRDTGGYHDKIRELRLKTDGAPQDVGNGFLFRDYDAGGLWYALEKSVTFHRLPPEIREKQMRRIMREAREQYSLGHMIAEYIRIYEKLKREDRWFNDRPNPLPRLFFTRRAIPRTRRIASSSSIVRSRRSFMTTFPLIRTVSTSAPPTV